jgi:polysaccharide biosynthesis transport protein
MYNEPTGLIRSSGNITSRTLKPSTVYNQLTILELAQIFKRRFRVVLAAMIGSVALGSLICVMSARKYEARGTIQVQRESADSLSRESILGSGPSSSDALDEGITIQTQAKILQSDSLALRTIRSLRLDSDESLLPRPNSFISWVIAMFHGTRQISGDKSNDSEIEAEITKAFHKNLSVEPVGGTRLIEVSFRNQNPELASSIVNQLVQELVQFNFETGYKATQAASEALSKQLSDLRRQSENLQAKVASMQRESGIYSIGTTDASGRQQAYSAVLEQFERSSSTLSDAAQNRILKEAIYHAAQTGDAETLSSLAGNTTTGAASSSITNSLGTIQNLRSQEGTLQGELDQLREKFDVGYPKIGELQANITSLERSIKEESDRITQRAHNDFLIADRTWKNAQEDYNDHKQKADALNNSAIGYMIARQEADDSRTLYEDLLKRLKEAGILEGLKSNAISVVDQAIPPIKPKQPNIPLYLVVSITIGIVLGSLVAMGIEALDDTVWGTEVIEQMGLPLIGSVPRFRGQADEFDPINSLQARYSDAIRGIRFALTHASNGVVGKVVLLTCATSDEETGELSVDVAASLARVGKRVLLVESDMRRPVHTQSMSLPLNEGLSRVLGGMNPECAILNHPRIRNLFVLPAGEAPHSASELIESQRMQMLLREWREAFDFVIINASPAIRFTDARYLSERADLTIQVASCGTSNRKNVRRAHELLSLHANGNVGMVLIGTSYSS